MLGASVLLILAAFVLTIVSAAWGRPPLWPAVLCLCVERIIAVAGR